MSDQFDQHKSKALNVQSLSAVNHSIGMSMTFLEQDKSVLGHAIVNDQKITYSASASSLGCCLSGSNVCAVDFAASVGMTFLIAQKVSIWIR
jgi:hypothetical protein